MKLQTRSKSLLSLESVAMTDIVMNLFIFFFISFSLLYTFNPNKESKIEVKLPETASSSESKSDAPLVVSVNARNEIFIGKDRVAAGRIRAALAERKSLAKAGGVLVRADKAASVETLVRVLDAAKQTGLDKLGVAVESHAS